MSLLTGALTLVHLAATPVTSGELPDEVLKDVRYLSEICEALDEHYSFKMHYISQADFNGDRHPDYIVDMEGFSCGSKTKSLINSTAGVPLYLYLSDGPNKWRKVFNGYVFEYRVKNVYGELPYFDVWIRGEVGYQINFVRYQWNGNEMEVTEQKLGVEVPKQMWKNFD